jgi:hypothetical protein
MIRKIKKGDKLYVTSKQIDVVSKLKPSSVICKYIELRVEDMREVVTDNKGKREVTFHYPELTYDGSMYNSMPETFLLQLNPRYGIGMFMLEVAKGANVLAAVPPLPGKLDPTDWVARVYLAEVNI